METGREVWCCSTMPASTRCFPGFHHQLFGRKPVGRKEQLQRKARAADALCLTQLHTLFEGVLPSWLATFKTARGSNSRHCIYTTLVTFWAFLAQVLDPDGSCRRAVTRVQILCSALGLALPNEDTGAGRRSRTAAARVWSCATRTPTTPRRKRGPRAPPRRSARGRRFPTPRSPPTTGRATTRSATSCSGCSMAARCSSTT